MVRKYSPRFSKSARNCESTTLDLNSLVIFAYSGIENPDVRQQTWKITI
jgi:hypothetical protein